MMGSSWLEKRMPPVVTNARGKEFVVLDKSMTCCECKEETWYIELDTLNTELKALCGFCSLLKYEA